MKVCILTIATNKYIQFVEPLYNTITQHFPEDWEINCVIFTDHEVETSDNVRVCLIDHEPWPMPTLKRYNYFVKEKDFILEHDYCFYLDADMRIDAPVGDEILGDLVATIHPYKFMETPEQFSYERRVESLAYIPMGEGINYFAGGFNGGKTESFIKMSEVIAGRVNEDLENGIVAIWHDESHMNRYMIDNPPSTILTPSYCFAEEFIGNSSYPYEPKIIALKKNHSALRS
jgi:histo-blood group ABO system transferase